MLRKLHRGENLNRAEIFEISNKFHLSHHSKERQKERFNGIDLKRAIRNCILAYYNTDGTINIAFNEFVYIVVAPEDFTVITIKEKSHNDINIWAKQEMAKQGIARRLN